MTDETNIEIDDEELEKDAEFLTAGQVAEFISQEFDEDELVHWGVWCKSDVESDLGVEITNEQWLKFLRLFVNDDVLNEVRAAAWMEAVDTIRQELGIE
jgi:acyl carrier protein